MQTNRLLETFTRAYIGTLIWSESELEGADVFADDLAPDTLAAIGADCAAFYKRRERDILCDDAPLSNEDMPLPHRKAAMAGHDFALTRNGHGAGFWDGDWPEPHASALDADAEAMGEFSLYIGDDGRIHHG